jgi:hypothetical protein
MRDVFLLGTAILVTPVGRRGRRSVVPPDEVDTAKRQSASRPGIARVEGVAIGGSARLIQNSGGLDQCAAGAFSRGL